MPTQNFATFRSLLRGAICTRTQAQFANESGISTAHLNRMLNMDTIHRPSDTTLHKIAAAAKNGITYQDLRDALDKDEPGSVSPEDQAEKVAQAASDFRPEFPEAARETMTALCASIKSQTYPVIASSLADHMDTLISNMRVDGPVLSYDLGIARPYFGTNYECAEKYVRVELSMADEFDTASSDMMLYFMEIPCQDGGVKYVIQGASCAVADIMEMFGMPPAALEAHEGEDSGDKEDGNSPLEKAMEDPFYLNFQEVEQFEEEDYKSDPGESVEQRLLRAIFGDKDPARYPVVTEGIGFYLKETPPKLMEFLLAHRESVLSQLLSEPQNYDSVAAAMDTMEQSGELQPFLDTLDGMAYCDAEMDSDLGWPAAIAAVMSKETGFPFAYKKASEDKDGKFPWLSKDSVILLPHADAERADIQREAILNATCHYARELGLKRFGDLIFANMETAYRNRKTYVIRENPEEGGEREEREREDGEYSVSFADTPHPAETGFYAVKLKDGRKMRIVFISGPNVWILLHKEWSNLIERYCPEPLPIPKSNPHT